MKRVARLRAHHPPGQSVTGPELEPRKGEAEQRQRPRRHLGSQAPRAVQESRGRTVRSLSSEPHFRAWHEGESSWPRKSSASHSVEYLKFSAHCTWFGARTAAAGVESHFQEAGTFIYMDIKDAFPNLRKYSQIKSCTTTTSQY